MITTRYNIVVIPLLRDSLIISIYIATLKFMLYNKNKNCCVLVIKRYCTYMQDKPYFLHNRWLLVLYGLSFPLVYQASSEHLPCVIIYVSIDWCLKHGTLNLITCK